MRVKTYGWACFSFEEFNSGQEIDLTPEKLFELFEKGYDVALWHNIESRRRKGKEIKIEESVPTLILDTGGKHFHSR